MASRFGDLETVRALLEDGADVETRDEQGNTPLHLASRAEHHMIVQFLLDSGADVEAQNGSGESGGRSYCSSHGGRQRIRHDHAGIARPRS